jgi:hypothetical protein
MGTCTASTQMTFFINSGSWDLKATSMEEAFMLAEGIVEAYASQCHPWGTIDPQALISAFPHYEEEEYVPLQGTYK